MRSNKLRELATLMFRYSLIFIVICFAASGVGVALAFMKVGYVSIDWQELVFDALKKGVIVGSALGVGLWIKARLLESKKSHAD